MNYIKLSLKAKSLIFILLLILILLFTLYYQNKTSYKNYLFLLHNNYKNSIDNYYNSFQKSLLFSYNNLSVYFNNDSVYKLIDQKKHRELEKKADEYFHALKENISYLKDINFIINTEDYKLKDPKGSVDIINLNENVYYRVLIPFYSKNKNYVLIEYLIDSKILLMKVKKYDGSNGAIYFHNTQNQLIEKYLDINKSDENFSNLLQSCKIGEKNLENIDGKFYVTKKISLSNTQDKKIATAIFFLDVTKEKLEYINLIKNFLITSVILFLLAAIIVNYFFTFLIKKINQKEQILIDINKNLEEKITTEIDTRLQIQKEAQAEKEKSEQILIQQSKLAMMGEMIGNIAHQWRQPLMQLSASIMYLDAYYEKGKLTKERFQKKVSQSISVIEYMSKTIEDFRNYYKPEKQKETFLIKESIDSALFIIDSSLKNSFIETQIYYSDENISINSFKNEFSQALLNIIANAKDILLLRSIKNPKITIHVYEEENHKYIVIEDNAYGIEEDIISKVFEPYFTTKHKSQGTGIGLYMTKMIIENNIGGVIKVENGELGAKFTVILD